MLLLLDERTGNLNQRGAEALPRSLEFYQGAALAITHDH